MKTVGEFKKAGLVFVGDDKLRSETNNHDSDEICMSRCWLGHGIYRGFLEVSDCYFANKEWVISSFAWRENTGVKPEYNGVIEVELNGGHKRAAYVSGLIWILGFGSSIARWRPVVLQSESPTVSPKEDKTMKPVYTAEMHARNELPPVGSEVKVCIEEAGFDLDGNDSKFEGKEVTVKAAFINKGETKVVAIESDKGKCACYIIECIKPIIKTIKVNGFDVPAPMSEAPMIGDEYYTPQTGYEVFYCKNSWRCDKFDSRFLSRGLIHSTESAAVAHAKAMLGIDPNA